MKRSRGAILAAATQRLGLTTGNGGMAAGLRLPASALQSSSFHYNALPSVQNRPPKPDQPHPPYWA